MESEKSQKSGEPQKLKESGRAADRVIVAESLYSLLVAAIRQDGREISLTAAATLGTLDRCGPRRITELAVSEGVAQPSMTALVTGLERAGLVERGGDPADQRVVLVALTAAGHDYLRRRRRAGADRFNRLLGRLPGEELDALLAAAPALAHLQQIDAEQRLAGAAS
jgi:DNA-binding MarR family transcriptional regulator